MPTGHTHADLKKKKKKSQRASEPCKRDEVRSQLEVKTINLSLYNVRAVYLGPIGCSSYQERVSFSLKLIHSGSFSYDPSLFSCKWAELFCMTLVLFLMRKIEHLSSQPALGRKQAHPFIKAF